MKRTFSKLQWVSASALALLVFAASGCVSKSKAEAQARAAYVAGQQDALARSQRAPSQAGTVTINGMVRQSVLPWTQNMTVATALMAADYYGPDPTQILIVRAGRAMNLSPEDLLNGRDVQLLAGDVVQIQTGAPAGGSPLAVPR